MSGNGLHVKLSLNTVLQWSYSAENLSLHTNCGNLCQNSFRKESRGPGNFWSKYVAINKWYLNKKNICRVKNIYSKKGRHFFQKGLISFRWGNTYFSVYILIRDEETPLLPVKRYKLSSLRINAMDFCI